jgi:hypothetical protein
MSLYHLNNLRTSKDLPKELHNLAIDEAISDVYAMKLSTTGFNSTSEQIVKLLKSLKQPPESYTVSE